MATLTHKLTSELTNGVAMTTAGAAKRYAMSYGHARRTLADMAISGFVEKRRIAGEIWYFGKQYAL